jgi:hypothetical protein
VVRLVGQRQLDWVWSGTAERIFQPGYPDGRSRFTVDCCGTHYRLWFEGYGRYLVAADGTEIFCQREGVRRAWRERFLFAQALPLAAMLRGFDLLHASAVGGSHGVAAFVAPSGTGKTTLASRLVLRGARFVTDDALALSPRTGGPLAHPGPPFMAVPNRDRGLLQEPAAGGTLGPGRDRSDKLHAHPPTDDRPLPLRALFYLERAPRLDITELGHADPGRVLAGAFAPYLMTADRLARHLEIAQQVSWSARQYRLRLPQGADFAPALRAVESRLAELAI